MKKTVLAIAFAFATAAFAAQTPANPPASTAGQDTGTVKTTKPAKKKHSKKVKKSETTKSAKVHSSKHAKVSTSKSALAPASK